jgi:hypothetical protein
LDQLWLTKQDGTIRVPAEVDAKEVIDGFGGHYVEFGSNGVDDCPDYLGIGSGEYGAVGLDCQHVRKGRMDPRESVGNPRKEVIPDFAGT